MDKWKEIEAAAKKIGIPEIEINDRIKLLQLADDSYGLSINGALRQIDKAAMTDINNIRKELGLPEDTSKVRTGRMPCGEDLDADNNPLLPDDDEWGSGVVDGSIADKKKKDRKDGKNPFDENILIPD